MPRTKSHRCVNFDPKTTYFKPRGIPARRLREIKLERDEIEAIRLRNYEGLYQESAAEMMQVSRQTFGRILESANRKIADALIHGKAIKIDNKY